MNIGRGVYLRNWRSWRYGRGSWSYGRGSWRYGREIEKWDGNKEICKTEHGVMGGYIEIY